jgi:rare lipoprotein A
MKQSLQLGIVLLSLSLAGCASQPTYQITDKDGAPSSDLLSGIQIHTIANATPAQEAASDKGNPEFYVTNDKRYIVLPSAEGYHEIGIASWYGTRFHSLKTSNGEPYDMLAMTAAHKTLPLPTYVKVTNLENGKSVVVRVNDRGPFKPGRIIDLSYTAAVKLGMTAKGTAKVEVEALAPYPTPLPPNNKYYYYLELATSKDPNQINSYLKRLNAKTEMTNLALKERKDWFLLQAGPYDRAIQADTQAKYLVSLGFKDPRLFQRDRVQ